MNDLPLLRFYLEPGLRESAAAGAHPFIAKMANVLENARFRVEYCDHGAFVAADGAYSLSHMKTPPDQRGLVFRRAYQYPFWQIDACAERWQWDVAKAKFDPGAIDPQNATQFYRFWQKRLYGDAPQQTARTGFVYVPLQGRLAKKRSFQSCSPLEMLEHCIAHAGGRRIIATLHPNEMYGETDIASLEALAAGNPQLEVRTGEMIHLLQTCDYVVSQNSSAAFAGFFFGKPALLFGEIDFHHIEIRPALSDLHQSFETVATHAPDYARYLYWFWQIQSINAGRDDAEERIAARLKRFGWPMK